MASIPNKVEKFKELDSDLSTSIAQALWQKAAQVCEYVNLSFPVGMLMFFHGSQEGLPSFPDPKYWQYADGSVVSNSNSPINGQTLPDLRGKFFKHPATGQIALTYAGVDSIDFTHNHGGLTTSNTDVGNVRLDDGGDRGQAIGFHAHVINNAPLIYSTLPAYLEVQVYVRIV